MNADLTPLSESEKNAPFPDGNSIELLFPGTPTDQESLSVTTPDHLLSEHILGSIPLWEAKSVQQRRGGPRMKSRFTGMSGVMVGSARYL